MHTNISIFFMIYSRFQLSAANISLNKRSSALSRPAFPANAHFSPPAAVRKPNEGEFRLFDDTVSLERSRLSDFNQRLFLVSRAGPGFQSYIIMYIHTDLHTLTHTHTHTSHQVSKRCSDLTGNGPVVLDTNQSAKNVYISAVL